jgi:hypothetical protein
MSNQYKDYPLSYTHQMFLEICPRGSEVGSTQRNLTNNEAILIKPRADIRRTQKAFSTLVKRHESLRMRMVESGKGWKVRVFDKHPIGIQIDDIGDVSDEEFQKIVSVFGEQTFNLDSPVFFNVRIMRFGARGDLIFFKICNVVCDGFSGVVLIEEFLHLLIFPMSFMPRPVTYREYLKNHNSPNPRMRAANKKYWASQLLPTLPAPDIGRISKGLQPDIDMQLGRRQKTISVSLGKKDTVRFTKFAHSQSWTPFGAALAAFGLAVMEKAGCNGIYLDVTLGARGRELDRYVGNHVFGTPIRCECDQNTSLDVLAIRLTQIIRSNLQHLPDPNGKYLLGLHKKLVAEGGHPRQFKFGFGQALERQNRSVLSHTLDINKYQVTKLGQYQMERIRISTQLHSYSEFRCRFDPSKTDIKITGTYETSAFEEPEAKDLLQAMKRHLIGFLPD